MFIPNFMMKRLEDSAAYRRATVMPVQVGRAYQLMLDMLAQLTLSQNGSVEQQHFRCTLMPRGVKQQGLQTVISLEGWCEAGRCEQTQVSMSTMTREQLAAFMPSRLWRLQAYREAEFVLSSSTLNHVMRQCAVRLLAEDDQFTAQRGILASVLGEVLEPARFTRFMRELEKLEE